MGRLPEEELLRLIHDADYIVSDREVFVDLVEVTYSELSSEPTDEEVFSNADNPCVVIDDTNCDDHVRMPIKIQQRVIVYQDCKNGCIYPDESSNEPYSEAVQDALDEKDVAFKGGGFLDSRKNDLALFASFVTQLPIDYSEIILRSELGMEEKE